VPQDRAQALAGGLRAALMNRSLAVAKSATHCHLISRQHPLVSQVAVVFHDNISALLGWDHVLLRKVQHRAVGRITARMVADRAGVSESAVSRTFTSGASVASATRQKVLTAARDLGYQPDIIARSLMTGRTGLVGLVSNNFDNPAFMEVFDLFTSLLQKHGLKPLLANLGADADPASALSMLRQYRVDGVIFASSNVPAALTAACADAGIPTVHAFGRPSRHSKVNVVGADNFQGGGAAAELLLSKHYRRIAFLGGPRTATSTTDRLDGFRAGLAQAGVVPVIEVFGERYSHTAGQTIMQELLGQDIDAVMCGDDILAIGALDACRRAGRPVPQELGVLGFNDIAMASWPSYNLSTIRQPIIAITRMAVQHIIEELAGNSPRRLKQQFQCEAVLRGTLR
jgi:DNA-binding LacI/PurR family transcriptional regulator